ncbi:MAG: hypothetical protein H0U70_03510 [Tatlockia sp.]|nr:hypothetical protein [Tatlockia sp.]
MKITFPSLKGYSNLVWNYNELNDQAFCSVDNILQDSKYDIFKLPQGITLQENLLVINHVKKNSLYPYKEVDPIKEISAKTIPELSLPVRVKFHTRSRSYSAGSSSDFTEKFSDPGFKSNLKILSASSSSLQLRPKSLTSSENFLPSSKNVKQESILSEQSPRIRRPNRVLSSSDIPVSFFTLSKKHENTDYPETLLLDDLINGERHIEKRGETTAYKFLYDKQVKDLPASKFLLNTNQSLACPNEITVEILKLKKDLIIKIEEILKEFQAAYVRFRLKQNLSRKTLKEISEYFVHAVLNTMTNHSFRKALSEYQILDLKEKDLLFNGNSKSFIFFNELSLELRLKALTINWWVLIDDSLDLQLSSAATLSDDTIATLNLFRISLKQEFVCLKIIEMQALQMNKILRELITAEQEQSQILQNYIKATGRDRNENINNNFSLKTNIFDFIKSFPMKPLVCDLLPTLQNNLATMIVKKIINKFSSDREFNKKYQSTMANIYSDSTDDLYFSDKWKDPLEKCLALVSKSHDFKRKMKSTMDNSLIATIVSTVEENVYECFKSLIISSKTFVVKPKPEATENLGVSCL